MDEYDEYDVDLTGADLAALDAATASAMSTPGSPRPSVPPITPTKAQSPQGASIGGKRSSSAGARTTNVRSAKASASGNGSRRRAGSSRSYTSTSLSKSPYERYRSWRKTLSVSDLVGPAWCEVQFDYGLQQGRHKKLSERPESFITPEGKEIVVEKEIATKNDRILAKGQSVHKKLEKELRPEEIEVPVVLPEERWALKLVQMTACMQDLSIHGYCREMPVFGIIDGLPVTGIIDEIARQPLKTPESEATLNDSGKRASTPPQSQGPRNKKLRSLSSILSHATSLVASLHQTISGIPLKVHMLSISDTKTRNSSTMPSDDDARQSRLQLMLYHRLLSELTLTTFDFGRYWAKLELDGSRALSDSFLTQALRIAPLPPCSIWPRRPTCLDDFTSLFSSACEILGVESVDRTLTLVYRTRASSTSTLISRRRRPKQHDEDVGLQRAIEASLAEAYDTDLALAIAASLEPQPTLPSVETSGMSESINTVFPAFSGATLESSTATLERSSSTLEKTYRPAFANSSEELAYIATNYADVESAAPEKTSRDLHEADEGERVTDLLISKDQANGDTSAILALPATAEEETETENEFESEVIGQKTFSVDNTELSAYLEHILAWWRGLRRPEGVALEQTRRCFSCEYRNGCEWREKKVHEIDIKLGRVASGAQDSSDTVDAVATMF